MTIRSDRSDRDYGLSILNFHTHRIGGSRSRAYVIHGRFSSRYESGYFRKVWRLIRKLYRLDKESPDKPIILIIRSFGGDYDTLNLLHEVTVRRLRVPVYTVADKAGSAAAIIFIGGEEGHRYLLEGGNLVLHNPRLYSNVYIPLLGFWRVGGVVGMLLEQILRFSKAYRGRIQILKRIQAEMIYSLTGGNKNMLQRLGDWSDEEDREKILYGITCLLEKDQYFNTEEAIACGLADEVIDKKRLREFISGLD